MYRHTLIKEFLDVKNVPYKHRSHLPAFTAKEVAAKEHVSAMMMAKTVVVKRDHRYILAVLPAATNIDLKALQQATGARHLRLATEEEFQGLFPDSEVGAMPPFGNLYGIPVYVETSLACDPEIIFNAGTHQDTIRMRYEDFSRLVEPEVCSFALVHAA